MPLIHTRIISIGRLFEHVQDTKMSCWHRHVGTPTLGCSRNCGVQTASVTKAHQESGYVALFAQHCAIDQGGMLISRPPRHFSLLSLADSMQFKLSTVLPWSDGRNQRIWVSLCMVNCTASTKSCKGLGIICRALAMTAGCLLSKHPTKCKINRQTAAARPFAHIML